MWINSFQTTPNNCENRKAWSNNFCFNLSLSSLNVIIEVFMHVTDTPTTARKTKQKKRNDVSNVKQTAKIHIPD